MPTDRMMWEAFPIIRREVTMLRTPLANTHSRQREDAPVKFPSRTRLWIVRALCLGSWAMVTTLLLVPDPSGLVGLREGRLSGYSTIAHIGCFFVLSTLTLASGLPFSMPATLALLVSYGGVVELLQGLVPRRTVSFSDFIANTLGIAVGAAAYAAAEWYRRRRTGRE